MGWFDRSKPKTAEESSAPPPAEEAAQAKPGCYAADIPPRTQSPSNASPPANLLRHVLRTLSRRHSSLVSHRRTGRAGKVKDFEALSSC